MSRFETYTTKMNTNWEAYRLNKKNRVVFVFSFVVLGIVLFSFLHFLTFIENRKGVSFDDPFLRLFPPFNLSPAIFIITYSLASAGITMVIQKPELFLKLVQVYTILTLLRILTLFLVALEPPTAIIPLQDALLQSTFYSGRENLKDLFFSGHVSILFVMAFVLSNTKLKGWFIIGAIVVGILLMLQHVHYSIDVIAAPVFAYIAFTLQRKINLQ